MAKQTYSPIKARVRYKADSDIESMPVDKLNLSVRASNALQRVGIKRIGQIIDNWYRLTNMPARQTLTGSASGIGMTTEREIKACVFAYLCGHARVTLSINTEGCAR